MVEATKPPRVLVVDGMSLFKTAAGAMAFLDNGLAFNFFQQLTSTLKKNPEISGVMVCWEGGFKYRTEIYPEYKATRKENTSETKEQRKKVQELLTTLGVSQVMAEGHEADDVGAWLSHNLGTQVLLLSNDQDWLQLVSENVSIIQKSAMTLPKKNQKVEITKANFSQYTGWPNPEGYLLAKCLMGDKDEVPGVAGIGKDTCRNYVCGIPVSPAKKKTIEAFMDSPEFQVGKKLGDLITPKDLQLVAFPKDTPDKEAVRAWMVDMKWHSVLAKFDDWWQVWMTSI